MDNHEILIDTEKSRLFVIKNFTEDYIGDLSNVISLLHHEPEIMVRVRLCNQRRNVGFFDEK